MELIRKNTFETNSSSTHSITMCMQSDYEKWKNGELYYCIDDGKFYTEQERKEMLKKIYIKFAATEFHEENGTYVYKGTSVNSFSDLDKLCTKENLDEITDEQIEEYFDKEYDYYEIPITFKEYEEYCEQYEEYDEEFSTPSGEKVVAFGYYGYDG